jgi:hypothetical protein
VHAAGALIVVDPGSLDSVLPVLLGAARSQDTVASDWAIHFLGTLGNRAKAAVPQLKLLATEKPARSAQINQALQLIEADPNYW